jgi:dienelactone hydrolase
VLFRSTSQSCNLAKSLATYTLSISAPGYTAKSITTTSLTGSAGTIRLVSAATDPAPTAASAAALGPLTIQKYASGIATASSFTEPQVWYPTNGTPPYPGIVWVPGHCDNWKDSVYTVTINGKTVVEGNPCQWAYLLASHGFIVMFVNSTDYCAGPSDKGAALTSAVPALVKENTRSGSPIFGKLDTMKIGVMGHSYGGSGALLAANNAATTSHIKAAFGCSPVGATYPNDKIPSLIIGAIGDEYASDFPAQYASIPAATSKAFALFPKTAEWNSMHCIACVPLGTHATDPIIARTGLSFFKVFLTNDARYKQFIASDPSMNTFSSNIQ